jgi:hypothetical protein
MKKQKQKCNVVVNQVFICCEQNGILPLPTVYKGVETVRHYSQCDTAVCFSKNSLSAERRLPCCQLSSWSLHCYSTARPTCYIVRRERCCSVGPTSRSLQEWDRVSQQATQIFRFVLSIDLGSGCLNTAWHREKDGQGALSCSVQNMYRLAVVGHAVNVHMEIVNGSSLTVQVVADRSGSPVIPAQTYVENWCWKRVSWKEFGFSSIHMCWLRVFTVPFHIVTWGLKAGIVELQQTFIVRQHLGKHILAATNTYATIEELLFLCNGEVNTVIVRKRCFLWIRSEAIYKRGFQAARIRIGRIFGGVESNNWEEMARKELGCEKKIHVCSSDKDTVINPLPGYD